MLCSGPEGGVRKKYTLCFDRVLKKKQERGQVTMTQKVMQISIEYCGTCNYRPIAAALAFAIQEALGIKAILVHSTKIGAFEVIADGETVFSKSGSGAFPLKEEIIDILRGRLIS
jgi:selT/selW/selH-like putative selenoprotein